jgi:hypothetical protein
MTEKDRQSSLPADADPRAPRGEDEPFLQRWSRLKADSAARPGNVPAVPEPDPRDASAPAASDAPDEEALPPGDDDMPPIESLNEDSDYSGFLSPRVSTALRKQALRKLFRSPKFNVISELDDYIDDYRNFPALGDIITTDMKHAAARLLEKELRAAKAAEAAEAASASDAAAVAAAGEGAAAPEATGSAEPAEHPTSETAEDMTERPEGHSDAAGPERTPGDDLTDQDDSEEPARDA